MTFTALWGPGLKVNLVIVWQTQTHSRSHKNVQRSPLGTGNATVQGVRGGSGWGVRMLFSGRLGVAVVVSEMFLQPGTITTATTSNHQRLGGKYLPGIICELSSSTHNYKLK